MRTSAVKLMKIFYLNVLQRVYHELLPLQVQGSNQQGTHTEAEQEITDIIGGVPTEVIYYIISFVKAI